MADRTTALVNAGSNYGEFQRVDGTYGQVALARRHVDLVLNTSGSQAGATSADLPVGDYDELLVLFNFTGFTGGASPTIALVIKAKGGDGIYYSIASPAALSAVGTVLVHLGKGCATNVLFGDTIQTSVTVTGAPTAAPWTLSVKGK